MGDVRIRKGWAQKMETRRRVIWYSLLPVYVVGMALTCKFIYSAALNYNVAQAMCSDDPYGYVSCNPYMVDVWGEVVCLCGVAVLVGWAILMGINALAQSFFAPRRAWPRQYPDAPLVTSDQTARTLATTALAVSTITFMNNSVNR